MGKPCSQKTKDKISRARKAFIEKNGPPAHGFQKGHKYGVGKKYMLGKKLTEESRRKMSEAHIGRKKSPEHCKAISRANSGEKCHFWKGGVTQESKRIRQSAEYATWRKRVLERDNWTCLTCGERGGELHPDHIKPFSLYPDLRFSLENGRTLCAPCHRKTPTYGSKIKRYVKTP